MANELTIIEQVRQKLDKREHEFRALLPAHIRPGQFIRIAQTAMLLNEELQKCTQKSLIIACTKAAEVGLPPDGVKAALVPFNVKVSKKNEPDIWEKQAKFIPMVEGLRDLVRQSGVVREWKVRLVHSQDRFRYVCGDVETLEHEPADVDNDPIVKVYSIAYAMDGSVQSRHVMRIETVERIRRNIRAPSPAWGTSYPEMVEKTCLKRHSKALPQSNDDLERERFRGALGALEAVDDFAEAPAPSPLLEAPRQSMQDAARQRLADAVENGDYDRETGEIYPAAEEEQPSAGAQPAKRGRRSAADKLAEVEAGRVARMREAEEREAAKKAAKAKQEELQSAVDDFAADIRVDENGHATMAGADDPAPNGFRNEARDEELGEDGPEDAFRYGWNSRFESKTRVPPRSLNYQRDVSAWMSGYDQAQKTIDIGNTPGTPQASSIMCSNAMAKLRL